ncbi:MAG: DUF6020 family protein [Butyrivibrio sp.]|nr:DUF6020 family protein [Butyrivibrio sp.]
MTEKLKKWNIGKAISVIITLAAITIKPEYDLKNHFLKYSYQNIFATLFVIAYVAFFYDRIMDFLSDRKNRIVCIIMGAFAAFAIVVGYSFDTTGSIDVVRGALIKNAIRFMALGYAFTTLFALVFIKINDLLASGAFMLNTERKLKGLYKSYIDILHKKPFITAVVTVFIILIPCLIAAYPAIFMGDTRVQLAQAFNSSSYNHYDVEYGATKLDNHHPLAHTMLMYICVKIGVAVTGSWNVGMFIYTLIQYVFMLACIGYVVKTFVDEKFGDICSILFMLYVVFAGGHSGRYIFLATKDIIYSGFLILFTIGLYKALKEQKFGRFIYIGGIGMLAFRKEAFYILLLTIVLCMILALFSRKKLALLFAGVVVIHVMWNNVLVPAMGIHAGSTREVLSLPLQMTGRYVLNYPDEVTDEEREAIDAIVNYEKIAENYDPKHSSPIKNTFREDSTKADLMNYFKVFFKMFPKHPQIYLYALIEFKYELFYPKAFNKATYLYSYSANRMERANEFMGDVGADFHYPDNAALTKFRDSLCDAMVRWNGYPIINMFNSAATYVWWVIIAFALSIIKKNKGVFIITLPLIATILFCILGPQSGGHIRYMYPLQMALPCISAFALKLIADASNR